MGMEGEGMHSEMAPQMGGMQSDMMSPRNGRQVGHLYVQTNAMKSRH